MGLLHEGYAFIGNRCRRYRSDIFETRLMLERFVCFTGEDAAAAFYDTSRSMRKGSALRRVKELCSARGACRGSTVRRTRLANGCSCR